MKKTYAVPTLVGTGNVVRETLGSEPSGGEFAKQPLTAGRVGFYL
jgi:hypothetical protein